MEVYGWGMEVINMQVTKRLVVELPESQHKAIKAKALLQGVSMREYVLKKLSNDLENSDYDMTDVSSSVVKALQEVGDHLKGKKKLGSARSFFSSIND